MGDKSPQIKKMPLETAHYKHPPFIKTLTSHAWLLLVLLVTSNILSGNLHSSMAVNYISGYSYWPTCYDIFLCDLKMFLADLTMSADTKLVHNRISFL